MNTNERGRTRRKEDDRDKKREIIQKPDEGKGVRRRRYLDAL